MGNSTSPISAAVAAAAKSAGQSAQNVVQDVTSDPRLAAEHAGRAIGHVIGSAPAIYAAIGVAVSFLADLMSGAVAGVTKVKQNGSVGIHDLVASLLSDSLLIEVDPGDIPDSAGAGNQFRINAALGNKFLSVIKGFMGAGGTVTGDTAEAGAAALLGLGMQMSVNTGLMAIIGGLVPEVHLDELKEIGEMLEKTLGLGRLNRQALRPYVQNFIAKPLDRKVRAIAQQDIIAPAELVLALNSGRMDAAAVHNLLQQHGYPDDQIKEIITQRTPRLSAEELYTLGLFKEVPGDSALNSLIADGLPTDTATARLRAIQLKAAHGVEQHYVRHVDSLVRSRVVDTTTGTTLLQGTTISEDELHQYQQQWDLVLNNPAKRLGLGEMLFLYEAAQVTIAEVSDWATAEGYTAEDSARLQLYFELKATATAAGKAKSQAAAAAHVHAEHTAYVNDVFEGAQGRAPSPAELSGWVALLDNRQRTRADVKTEVKLNPTPPTS